MFRSMQTRPGRAWPGSQRLRTWGFWRGHGGCSRLGGCAVSRGGGGSGVGGGSARFGRGGAPHNRAAHPAEAPPVQVRKLCSEASCEKTGPATAMAVVPPVVQKSGAGEVAGSAELSPSQRVVGVPSSSSLSLSSSSSSLS